MSDLIDLEVAVDPVRIRAHASTELRCSLKLRSGGALLPAGTAPLETSVCLLFDCSASMTKSKLKTAIDAAKAIVDLLPSRYRLSLVGFQSRTRVLVDNARPAENKLDAIKQQIDAIRSFAGGSTNLAGGITHAVQILRSQPADARVMFILSDGQADSVPKAQTAALEATQAGVQLFAVGIGNDYAADHLLELVTPSNGAVFGEHDMDRITATFAHLLGRVESFVATNARLALSFGEGVTPGAAYKMLPERAFLGVLPRDGSGAIQVNVGNIEAGRAYGFLMVANMAPAGPGTYEVARATLTYDALGQRAHSLTATVRVVVAEAGDVTGDHEVEAAFRGVRLAQLVQGVAQANRARDTKQIAARLADLLRQADEAGDEQLAAQCRAVLARVKAGGTIPPDLLNALVLGSTRAVAENATDSTRPAVQPAPAPTPTPGPTPAPGSVSGALVDMVLLEPGAALILVIREIRDATGLGLREVTDLVRSAPGPILTAVPKAEAEKMRRRLEAAGARIELRPHL